MNFWDRSLKNKAQRPIWIENAGVHKIAVFCELNGKLIV